jgi:hypothetical protein
LLTRVQIFLFVDIQTHTQSKSNKNHWPKAIKRVTILKSLAHSLTSLCSRFRRANLGGNKKEQIFSPSNIWFLFSNYRATSKKTFTDAFLLKRINCGLLCAKSLKSHLTLSQRKIIFLLRQNHTVSECVVYVEIFNLMDKQRKRFISWLYESS